ncbi:MAG: GrpB family protein [Patescibacteria group bacterium]
MLGLKRGVVKLAPHNPKWAKAFKREKRRLFSGLKNSVIAIEHIGRTAMPGIPARPILDMAVGIKNMAEAKKLAKPLERLGYEWRKDVHSPRSKLFFVRGPEHKRTHYLHLMKYGGKIWQNDLLFRDYLRTHKKAAREYATLKRKLAARFADNRTKYTFRKGVFIHRILKEAVRHR